MEVEQAQRQAAVRQHHPNQPDHGVNNLYFKYRKIKYQKFKNPKFKYNKHLN